MPIDTVLYFKPGEGQNSGQASIYFPQNIFNLPNTKASQWVPASSPEDVCSIGLGGEIVVGWKDFELTDDEGADFTIFENPFINPANQKVFAEPGVVSVSYDGINFYEFPFDSITLEGCAGIIPTNGSADFCNPLESGGNAFDLATVGLKKIRWIKIKDFTYWLLEQKDHPFYNPILSGFDLDCVVGLYLQSLSSANQNFFESSKKTIFVKTNGKCLKINSEEILEISLFDFVGNLLLQETNFFGDEICFENFANGSYILLLKGKVSLNRLIVAVFGDAVYVYQ